MQRLLLTTVAIITLNIAFSQNFVNPEPVSESCTPALNGEPLNDWTCIYNMYNIYQEINVRKITLTAIDDYYGVTGTNTCLKIDLAVYSLNGQQIFKYEGKKYEDSIYSNTHGRKIYFFEIHLDKPYLLKPGKYYFAIQRNTLQTPIPSCPFAMTLGLRYTYCQHDLNKLLTNMPTYFSYKPVSYTTLPDRLPKAESILPWPVGGITAEKMNNYYRQNYNLYTSFNLKFSE